MKSIDEQPNRSEEELANESRRLIESFLKDSGGEPWFAWRASVLKRVEVDYADMVLTRAEHYLLRYAVAHSGLEDLVEKIRANDEDWYHRVIRPVKCHIGMSSRDPLLKDWEELGYEQGWDRSWSELELEQGSMPEINSEHKARWFMFETTNMVIDMLNADRDLRRRRRGVYYLMKLHRWYQK